MVDTLIRVAIGRQSEEGERVNDSFPFFFGPIGIVPSKRRLVAGRSLSRMVSSADQPMMTQGNFGCKGKRLPSKPKHCTERRLVGKLA